MDDVDAIAIGKAAYEAYCETVGWKSFNGDQLPTWEQQLESKPGIAYAWVQAGNEAVRKHEELGRG